MVGFVEAVRARHHGREQTAGGAAGRQADDAPQVQRLAAAVLDLERVVVHQRVGEDFQAVQQVGQVHLEL